MRQSSRVTITDIARVTKTSPATVSRVLNHADYPVSNELRERILDAARELQYTPNIAGKMLKSGRSNDIGVVIPSFLNPFYSETIAGVERACRKEGYNPIFCTSENKVEKEWEYIQLLRQKCVEGMLISTINEDESRLLRFLEGERNVVLFDQPAQLTGCDKVTFDFLEAGSMAAGYLLDCGHREIAFLSTAMDRRSRQLRYEGHRKALAGAGIPVSGELLFVAEDVGEREDNRWEYSVGQELARKFLRSGQRATAIIAINDIVALGVIGGLTAAGVRVPEDISVMGFDDISFSAMFSPALTTIRQPSFEMGMIAAQLLIDKIDQEVERSSHILLKPELIERKSVRQLTE